MSPRIALVLVGLATIGAARAARAQECSNPCAVGDGDLCASTRHVVELGQSLAIWAGRQSGTCGGVKPLPDGELELTWSRDAAGPYAAVPFARSGDALSIAPDQAGAYFVRLAARDGKGAPDHLILLVAPPKLEPVRFHLRSPRGMSAKKIAIVVRWLPQADEHDFPRRRWPTWFDDNRPGHAEDPLPLPPGRYQIEWRYLARRPRHGVVAVDVTGPGTFDVALTPAK